MLPSLCPELNADDKTALLEIARASIAHGVGNGRPLVPDADDLAEVLQVPAAVFVTLTEGGQLRGCIGGLEARHPLAEAVARSAYNAAFQDRRFAPIGGDELERVSIEVSLLSEMRPLEVSSREQLLTELEPGVDGLLIEDHGHRATFLPKVWEKISSPEEFLQQLMFKAGLGARHWSSTIRCHRYHTLTFAEN